MTNDRMIWSVFALYPHLLVALLVLLIAGLGWVIAVTSETTTSNKIDREGLLAIQSMAIPALVVARPEGSVMAAVAMLPTLLCGGVTRKSRMLLLLVLALSVLAWNLLLIKHATHQTLSVVGPLAIAAIGLIVAALLLAPKANAYMAFLEERCFLIILLVEAALWMALLGAAVWNSQMLLTSIGATGQNLFYGAGGWGYSLIVIGVLVLVCAVAVRERQLIFLRFPVTSFIPLGFLLAYLREEAYRVGYGDSLNRMWIHILPLAVLFVVAALNSDRWRWTKPASKS
jgi:hypothetical protein